MRSSVLSPASALKSFLLSSSNPEKSCTLFSPPAILKGHVVGPCWFPELLCFERWGLCQGHHTVCWVWWTVQFDFQRLGNQGWACFCNDWCHSLLICQLGKWNPPADEREVWHQKYHMKWHISGKVPRRYTHFNFINTFEHKGRLLQGATAKGREVWKGLSRGVEEPDCAQRFCGLSWLWSLVSVGGVLLAFLHNVFNLCSSLGFSPPLT